MLWIAEHGFTVTQQGLKKTLAALIQRKAKLTPRATNVNIATQEEEKFLADSPKRVKSIPWMKKKTHYPLVIINVCTLKGNNLFFLLLILG